jgi:hypothetical protein
VIPLRCWGHFHGYAQERSAYLLLNQLDGVIKENEFWEWVELAYVMFQLKGFMKVVK